jgi:hypothetical protein
MLYIIMRTLIDIPQKQIDELATICLDRKLSRAEAVRQAIDAYIRVNLPAREAAFGILRGSKVFLPGDTEPLPADGLAYQERLRSEW